MRLRIVASFSVTLAILAATIGFAGPVSAAPTEWLMPEVRGMVLSQAVKAVEEVTGSAKLDLRIKDYRNSQEVINQSYWLACGQNPAAGKAISQKTKMVIISVKRFNQSSCWY